MIIFILTLIKLEFEVLLYLFIQLILTGEADSYCIIKCEGETVRTSVDKGTSNPKWNTTAIFYRSKPDHPIIIEVS